MKKLRWPRPARPTSGEPTIRETAKCTEIGWFAPYEMPDDLTHLLPGPVEEINPCFCPQRRDRHKEYQRHSRFFTFCHSHQRLCDRLTAGDATIVQVHDSARVLRDIRIMCHQYHRDPMFSIQSL